MGFEDILHVIKGRRSIREFIDKEIPREHLTKIVEAGVWAPSGSNIQPWEFIVVDDVKMIEKVKLVSPGLFGNPKALIVICVNRAKYERGGSQGRLIALMDASMAAQNIMLEAYSLGVGSCPIASFNKLAVKELLKIPEHVEPVLIISLGYPSKWPDPPKRRPLKEVVHLNEYGRPYEG
ncbi:MAG: nitroreductase [Zestosphaera tikiterensis]|uniref:Nitroreductase n=1 Tax=Zestosphaera tikiterensis TaxID=1973259 RepID=A0A2R7Y8Z5_9CREN|nr:MAG: nitroreductase [Zestosphaera tikiterensis]